MCGLVGAFARPGAAVADEPLRAALAHMTRRGPDGEGTWRDDGVALGHRRLAIIDLDPRASQPMHSNDGRYVIAYNGEIFNYRELRCELEAQGVSFRTASDTEVILALFAGRGEAMLPRLHGMFAFVIWDRVGRRAFAARDPYGIKPLYFAETSQGALVASQVKALLATGLVSREPDLHGQAGFWLLGSVPEPRTWYRTIRALPAGHLAWIERGRVGAPKVWWDVGNAWRAAPSDRSSDAEVREHVRNALKESVTRHLVADVPVGVFLSGGIDSGALAGLMVEAGAHALEGVTLAYDEFSGRPEDEAPVAARIAAHYGIRHHVRRVTRDEFQSDLPRILDAMDQPSIDGINTWYASKAAEEYGLKVVVSGVGGDELFQGYESFRQLPRLIRARRIVGAVPGGAWALRKWADRRASRTSNRRWHYLPEWSRTIEGAWWLRRSLFAPADLGALMGDEEAKEVLRAFDPDSYVRSMSGGLPSDARLALGQIESTTYLRNQLLRDSDWASMDHGVELRSPLVDARMLDELKGDLPAFRRFPKKVLLARAPANALPDDIAGRRKTGFGIPVVRWQSQSGRFADSSKMRGWAREVAAAFHT
ncbi:MAG TPA: asparagine synthase (glutamine-hydrolyzing) [Casimicrobiaceae bacterium]|nr:asparagine synthase (glutamine-hydrolyzing) [Casimicrobiaceae bacterium]